MFRASPLGSQNLYSGGQRRSPQQTGLLTATESHGFPIDLIRFSIQAEKRKKKQYYTPQSSYVAYHSAPLVSINHRDVIVLDELFLNEQMTEIVEDIELTLEQLLPTPCWDDDPFEEAIDALL